ncbi:hypothetical protein [Granulicella sp. dw_53]|uniref:hypothetical protein n=1 Tax=Granulicella sp. dw_53 TaxID=2719792 RepID=UPI001BD1EFB3|nr:hypothetical protein [Granulicella sp. dw_53]
MRKIIVVGLILIVVILVIFRQRLFLRDPIAKVERNGTLQTQYRVYLNYFNDILVEDLEHNRRFLVQAKDGVPIAPGTPLHLQCLQAMACLTETNFAQTVPLSKEYMPAEVEMTNSFVAFHDGDGAAMRVSLR